MFSDDEDNVGITHGKGKNVDLIRKAIRLFEEKLEKGEVKVSAGEYIRLLELLQQVDGDEPREIRVTWVDKMTESDSTPDE